MVIKQLQIVTGAAGFIGSQLVDALLDRGSDVIGIDNLHRGRLSHLESARRSEKFRFLKLDAHDYDACVAALEPLGTEDSDCTVFHMAANSDIQAGVEDPDIDLRDTYLTTHVTLKWMRKLNLRKLAFASSSAIYGQHEKVLSEDSGPTLPISNYGAMKLASEGMISSAVEAFLERAWVFRFPNVVGPRATHGVIYDLCLGLMEHPGELEVLGDGTQQKPYLHVTELIDAMIFIWSNAKERLNYHHIGAEGSGSRVQFIAQSIVEEISPNATIRFLGGKKGWVGDVPRFEYSTEKLERLGWRPRLSSDEAVERAVSEIADELDA